LSVTTIINIDNIGTLCRLAMCFNQQKLLAEFPGPSNYVNGKAILTTATIAIALFMYELLRPPQVVMPLNWKQKCSCQKKVLREKMAPSL